jgi:threonine dehydrogenase-like Zn-dependent dehydrogenase
MRGLWLDGQTLRLRDDLAVPEPPAGEARVRVSVAGICNTDLELVRGYYPFTGIPGHEFVGRVEAAPGAPSWEGRRVVGEINASCGTCAACAAGRSTHCERRTVLGIRDRNGAFAEYLTLPLVNLHEVPAGVPDEAAVFTEPLAAALEIQEQVRIGPGDRVVVVGDGKLGNLIAQTLALTGCALTVAGRHSELPAGEADVAIECTGNAEGLERARAAVRARGTIVLKSTYRGRASLDVSRIVVDEITLVGSRCGPFAPALALLAANRVAVAPLVHARFPLQDAAAAFEAAARPGVLKVLVQMS